MSATTMPTQLPFRMRGGAEQMGWAVLTTLMGLGIGWLAMEGARRMGFGPDTSAIWFIWDYYLKISIPGLVVAAVGARMLFCVLVVDERGIVIENVFWRSRIIWRDLEGVDVVARSEVVDEAGQIQEWSLLRFHRGPGRRPIVARGSLRPGWRNAELTDLAAHLMVLKERAGLVTGPSSTPRGRRQGAGVGL